MITPVFPSINNEYTTKSKTQKNLNSSLRLKSLPADTFEQISFKGTEKKVVRNNCYWFKQGNTLTVYKDDREIWREESTKNVVDPCIIAEFLSPAENIKQKAAYRQEREDQRINSGGEGIVYRNNDGTATKEGYNVKPYEAKVLFKLQELGYKYSPRVYDYAKEPDSYTKIKMEFIEGPDLLNWMQTASEQELTEMVKKLARVFYELGKLGYSHGDMTNPENILLKPDGTIVLVDWSEAKYDKTGTLAKKDFKEIKQILEYEITKRKMTAQKF